MQKTLVCLSGTLCDAELWQPQAQALAGYTCVFPPMDTHATITDVVANMIKTLPEKFSLLGMSAGAVVALECIRQIPHRIEKLCIVAGNPHGNTPKTVQRLNHQLELAQKLGIRNYFEQELLPNSLSPYTMDNTPLRERIIAMAERVGITAFAQQIAVLKSRHDGLESLSHYKGEVLAVCGEDDTITPPDLHHQIATTAPNGRYIVLPKTGHYVNFENERGLNQALSEFFNQ